MRRRPGRGVGVGGGVRGVELGRLRGRRGLDLHLSWLTFSLVISEERKKGAREQTVREREKEGERKEKRCSMSDQALFAFLLFLSLRAALFALLFRGERRERVTFEEDANRAGESESELES